MRVIRLPRHPKSTRIYEVKITSRVRPDGEVQYQTTPPKRLMDGIREDKDSPFRVATTILTEKTMWLIVSEVEEEEQD